MSAIDIFLLDHARSHALETARNDAWSFEGRLLRGLTDEQLRLRPSGGNSIAWLLWHMARTEDVAMTLLTPGQAQVLDQAGWLERLNVSTRDIGTGMTDAEVGEFSEQVNTAALRAYRAAVGRRTQELTRRLRPEELDEEIDPAHVQALLERGVLRENARYLAEFWQSLSKGALLATPGLAHNFWHLAEGWHTRGRLGLEF